MLKVHRTEPKKLILSDDDRIYDSHEIKDILNMVDTGNRSKGQGQKTTGGLTRVKSAFGIAGFVRFHSGYYIVRIIFQPSLYVFVIYCVILIILLLLTGSISFPFILKGRMNDILILFNSYCSCI